ncbi:hypothetical protein PAPYR_12706 [Paratrimastix pyriformis]|uniref:THUMP domain-containing protein n=1 Tax=Paratrimastix pyriformis TaxID=342808 RepID=A0ABQ8U1G6_9EUKA|nr:hypothetical protein PAPYR_12706 [Paratrimastix pyriformis]
MQQSVSEPVGVVAPVAVPVGPVEEVLSLEEVEAVANEQVRKRGREEAVADQGEKKEKVAKVGQIVLQFKGDIVFNYVELQQQLRAVLSTDEVFVSVMAPDAFLVRTSADASLLDEFCKRNDAAWLPYCEGKQDNLMVTKAHLANLPPKATVEEVSAWLLHANPGGQVWAQPARQVGTFRVSITVPGVAPVIPEFFEGTRIVALEPEVPRPIVPGNSMAFLKVPGINFVREMRDFVVGKGVHVGEVWRTDVKWSSGAWDGSFCMSVPTAELPVMARIKAEVRAKSAALVVRVGALGVRKFK